MRRWDKHFVHHLLDASAEVLEASRSSGRDGLLEGGLLRASTVKSFSRSSHCEVWLVFLIVNGSRKPGNWPRLYIWSRAALAAAICADFSELRTVLQVFCIFQPCIRRDSRRSRRLYESCANSCLLSHVSITKPTIRHLSRKM